MGRRTFSYEAYSRTADAYLGSREPVTKVAEQQALATGKLNPLVDPAEYDVTRRSLLRFEERGDGRFTVAIGTSVPVESRVDTTGSMGNNVDVALRVLPTAFRLISQMLPGCDLHVATGIFGDISDNFPLCRPQFEMHDEKIIKQLTLMVPERGGADFEEDPHYGIFGGAYLVNAFINRIGLKRYDFTVTDAPARDQLSEKQLLRIFGPDVFDKVAQNGHQINRNDLPSTREVVQDLLTQAHAFVLQVGSYGWGDSVTTDFWTKTYGRERVIILPSTELLPQVQAVIIGLTEGTLRLDEVQDFLRQNNVVGSDAAAILNSVSNIPIGAQAALQNYSRRPKAGNIYLSKDDVWPVDSHEAATPEKPGFPVADNPHGATWL